MPLNFKLQVWTEVWGLNAKYHMCYLINCSATALKNIHLWMLTILLECPAGKLIIHVTPTHPQRWYPWTAAPSPRFSSVPWTQQKAQGFWPSLPKLPRSQSNHAFTECAGTSPIHCQFPSDRHNRIPHEVPVNSLMCHGCFGCTKETYTISASNVLADTCRNKKEIRDKHRIRLALCQKQRYA